MLRSTLHDLPAGPELISVVTPARNAGATIAETLDCLLAQSEPRWRALLVDDGSTDDTGAIMATYAARDSRFTVLAGPSAGQSQALNTALPLARGRWLHFLDADDWVVPLFYEKMLVRLATAPDAIAGYSGYHRVMPDGGMTPMNFDPEIAENAMEVFARRCTMQYSCLLLDREAVEKVGGFEPALKTCNDWDLFQRVARLPGEWAGLAEPLAFYRTSAGSLSRNLAQLEQDTRPVIERGFGADVRLAGLTLAHPNGVSNPSDSPELAFAWIALWNAAQRCRPEDNSAKDPQIFRPLPKQRRGELHFADLIIQGLVLGERVTANKLAALWPNYAKGVVALINLLGTAWEDPAAAHEVQIQIERRILDHADPPEPRRLDLTMALHVDIDDPAPTLLPEGVERVHAYLMRGEQIQAVRQFSLAGQVTRRRWVELILEEIEIDKYYEYWRARHGASLRRHLLFHKAAAVALRPRLLWRRGERRLLDHVFKRAALLSFSGPAAA